MKSLLHLKLVQIARFRVFESGTTPSGLSREATQGGLIQSFPGRPFPLQSRPSLPTCSYRSSRVPVSSLLEARIITRSFVLDCPSSHTPSHASSANPFAHADTPTLPGPPHLYRPLLPHVFFGRAIHIILNLCARSSSLPGSNAMFPCSQTGDQASYFDVGPTKSYRPEDALSSNGKRSNLQPSWS